jgi:molybdate transport system substrate-binding protein
MLPTWFCRGVAAILLLTGVPAFGADSLVVFAAASLTDSLQKVTDEYTKTSGTEVKLSFASSSALAKQIESGAGADVFISADREWMDYVAGKDLISPESRGDLLGNRLVLIAPADSTVTLKLVPGAPLLAALGAQGRLATGEPTSVPAGKYAKAALTRLGLWADLELRLARAENVRVALSYVARGEAPLGIVYATDAAVEPKVRVVDVFAESTYPPITYPVALTKTASATAPSYRQFLQGDAATAIFTKAGFTVLGAARPSGGGMISGCSGFAFDLSREIELLGAKPHSVTAAMTSAKAVALQAGKAYRVALVARDRVKFAVPAGKDKTQAKAYAGILRLTPVAGRSTVRVTLNPAAWVDLVGRGKALESTRYTGSRDCAQVRKSVEFTVEPGVPLTLQLSDAAAASIDVVVTES